MLENAEFVNEIVWSGEVSFKLSCTVDRQIAFTGPLKIRTFVAGEAVNLPGLTVWCGMSSGGFIGPLFFEGTVTVPSYLNLLWISIVPAIRRQCGNGELLST
jgi:hypothetical protein